MNWVTVAIARTTLCSCKPFGTQKASFLRACNVLLVSMGNSFANTRIPKTFSKLEACYLPIELNSKNGSVTRWEKNIISVIIWFFYSALCTATEQLDTRKRHIGQRSTHVKPKWLVVYIISGDSLGVEMDGTHDWENQYKSLRRSLLIHWEMIASLWLSQ